MTRGKYAIVVIGLIVVLGVFNYAIRMDPTQLAARGVGRDPHAHHHEHGDEEEAQLELPEPPDIIGPEDAPVLLEVFWDDHYVCVKVFQPLMMRIVEAYEPHVRAEFRSVYEGRNETRAKKLGLERMSGIAINGGVVKKLPTAAGFGLVAFRGVPGNINYSEQMLYQAIEEELKKEGIEFTPHAHEVQVTVRDEIEY